MGSGGLGLACDGGEAGRSLRGDVFDAGRNRDESRPGPRDASRPGPRDASRPGPRDASRDGDPDRLAVESVGLDAVGADRRSGRSRRSGPVDFPADRGAPVERPEDACVDLDEELDAGLDEDVDGDLRDAGADLRDAPDADLGDDLGDDFDGDLEREGGDLRGLICVSIRSSVAAQDRRPDDERSGTMPSHARESKRRGATCAIERRSRGVRVEHKKGERRDDRTTAGSRVCANRDELGRRWTTGCLRSTPVEPSPWRRAGRDR